MTNNWHTGYPPDNRIVLAVAKNECGRQTIIRAHYLRKHEVEADLDYDDYEPETDYDEVSETYYYSEGWYEQIDYWGELCSVHVLDPVTHWMFMPTLPQEKLL